MMLARIARLDSQMLYPIKHISEPSQRDKLLLKLRDSLVRQRVLMGRGGKIAKKRATVAVARKLAVVMLTLWKKQTDYQPLLQAA